MTIVTYNTNTKEVVSVAPVEIVSEEYVELKELEGIVANGYEYIIYNGTEPIFESKDGKVYLKDNEILLQADYLE